MGNAVDDGFGEAGVGKTLVHSPKGRLVVTITATLVALGDHLDEELGGALGQREV